MVHHIAHRHVRDLPVFCIPVELLVPRARLECPRCGPKLEQLSWLQPYARVTTWLAWSVSALCKVMSVRHVASFYGYGILAHCRFPLGTNLIEDINNKIKVITRMAYGFRDDHYFFLKIRVAFPGIR